MLYTLLIPAAVLVLLTCIAAVFLSRRSLQKKGIVRSRFVFAVYVFSLSQVVFLVAVVIATIFTAGFFLFVVPVFVISNIFAALGAFCIALAGYTPLIGRYYATATPPGPLARSNIALISIGFILAVAFLIGAAVFLGASYVRGLVDAYAVSTNNAALIDSGAIGSANDYYEIAKNSGDISVCDRIPSSGKKAECYQALDPEYALYEEQCALYTKHGNLDAAYGSQMSCVGQKYISNPFKNGDPLACDFETKFSENSFIGRMMNECTHTRALQGVIQQNVPAQCEQFITNPSPDTDYLNPAFDGCRAYFSGSEAAQRICAVYEEGGYPNEINLAWYCYGY